MLTLASRKHALSDGELQGGTRQLSEGGLEDFGVGPCCDMCLKPTSDLASLSLTYEMGTETASLLPHGILGKVRKVAS